MRRPLFDLPRSLGQLHDLWIILAWSGVLTAIMLNTLFNRSCPEFLAGSLTATCQSFTDLGLIFAAALVASLAMSDERIAIIGFLFVQLMASIFALIAFVAPSLFGLQDPVLRDVVISRSLLMLFQYAFPFGLFSSFLGAVLGLYLEGKLRLS